MYESNVFFLEGKLKIRDKDVGEKEVPLMSGILTKDRFSYYLDEVRLSYLLVYLGLER